MEPANGKRILMRGTPFMNLVDDTDAQLFPWKTELLFYEVRKNIYCKTFLFVGARVEMLVITPVMFVPRC